MCTLERQVAGKKAGYAIVYMGRPRPYKTKTIHGKTGRKFFFFLLLVLQAVYKEQRPLGGPGLNFILQ